MADLERIPDPAVNGPLIESLTDWINAGSPLDAPPVSPQGQPIRRVRLWLDGRNRVSREGLAVRGGIARFGQIVRVDVFRRGQNYVLVPINVVDIATRRFPPTLALRARKPRKDWSEVTDTDEFLFSIHRGSLIRITLKNGKALEGFFRWCEPSTLRIVLSDILRPGDQLAASPTHALSVEKFFVDRLGRRFPIVREKRTWRGKIAPWPAKTVSEQNNASLVEA